MKAFTQGLSNFQTKSIEFTIDQFLWNYKEANFCFWREIYSNNNQHQVVLCVLNLGNYNEVDL